MEKWRGIEEKQKKKLYLNCEECLQYICQGKHQWWYLSPFPSDPLCVQNCVAHMYMQTESDHGEVLHAYNISTFTSLPRKENICIYFWGSVY